MQTKECVEIVCALYGITPEEAYEYYFDEIVACEKLMEKLENDELRAIQNRI